MLARVGPCQTVKHTPKLHAKAHSCSDAGAAHPIALRTQVLNSDEISSLDAKGWDDLSRDALCENPFYARQYVIAGLKSIDRCASLRAFAIWTETGNLIGLFPFTRKWGVALGAGNIYQFSGAPLVHREHAVAVLRAWFNAIARGELAGVWCLKNVQTGSRLICLMADQATWNGLITQVVNLYSRPRLTRMDGGLQHHLGAILSKSRRKDIERSIRRLRENGELRLERSNTPETVRERLEQFLSLEQAGWKGAAKTAFGCNADDTAFARAAFGGSPGCDGLTTVDTLLLNNVPIAISINISSGATAFTPKCAYDETFRKWSPGLVLEYLVVERFYKGDRFADMDAATTVDGHVVAGLWNKEVEIGTLVVGTQKRTRLVARLIKEQSRAKSFAKGIVPTLRARPASPAHHKRKPRRLEP